MTYIDMTKEEYISQLNQFRSDVCELYKWGRLTFLREDEPFYFHCLRFYIPDIAHQTYETHKLGVGIYNMQGFERRNKESKRFLNTCCNNNTKNKKSLLTNNVRRLLRLYWTTNKVKH